MTPIKTLTLHAPWAHLVYIAGAADPRIRAQGKHIETRSWPTKYRGWIGIHVAKTFPVQYRPLCIEDPFYSSLMRWWFGRREDSKARPWEFGSIICLAHLADCIQMTEHNLPGEPERSFGLYEPGRWMWVFDEVRQLEKPIPAVGRQRLWTPGPEIQEQIRAYL